MLDLEYTKFKSKNWWRLTFICIGLSFFFGMCADGSKGQAPYPALFQFFGVAGGVLFVIMCVIRFEDVDAFMKMDRSD